MNRDEFDKNMEAEKEMHYANILAQPTHVNYVYYTDMQNPVSWSTDDVKSYSVNKWRWLWQQFLCIAGLSKKPYLSINARKSLPGLRFKIWCHINDDGYFEIKDFKGE